MRANSRSRGAIVDDRRCARNAAPSNSSVTSMASKGVLSGRQAAQGVFTLVSASRDCTLRVRCGYNTAIPGERDMSAREAFRDLSGHQKIEGHLVRAAGGAAIAVFDPATEERIGEIAEGTAEDVARAVAAANTAQRSWRKVNHHRRAELLHEVARGMMGDRALVAEMLTREMGKPYKESHDEVGWSASAIDYYAEIARHENGKVLGPAVDGQFHFTTKDPLGVVVIILPFNYPLCLLCWQAAAALASGNAVIIKPSDLTTLTTLEFIEAFDALPVGLVQVLSGGGEAGKQLVEHSD